MAYSEVRDVRLVLKGWSDPHMADDPDYTPAMLDDAQIEYAISDADAQINGTLRKVYAVPLPEPIPDLVHTLSVDMAATIADAIYRGSREYASELAPPRVLWAKCARILDRIGSGSIQVYNAGEGPEQVGNQAVVINPYPGDILLDTDVYPRGNSPDRSGQNAEYATRPIPQSPYRY